MAKAPRAGNVHHLEDRDKSGQTDHRHNGDDASPRAAHARKRRACEQYDRGLQVHLQNLPEDRDNGRAVDDADKNALQREAAGEHEYQQIPFEH